MAPLLFKEMKGVNTSRTSQATSSICTKLARLTIAERSSGRGLSHLIPHAKDLWRARTGMSSTSQAQARPRSHTQKSTKRNLAKQPVDDQFITPAGSSSRFLLNHDILFDVSNESRAPVEAVQLQAVMKDEPAVHVFEPTDCSITAKQEQVVVLRVSLHCKGCEKKVRKHISKIEGVASFDIDFAANKVTVVGELTPSEVLNRISKIKYAQLWPLPPSSTSSS